MTAPLLLAAISAAILAQLAIVIGVAFWSFRNRNSAQLPIVDEPLAKVATGAWSGWREFRVVGDAFEDHARTQRSLVLAPKDGQSLPDFAPGQYLTFSLDLPASHTEPKRTIVRCYSLSDGPNGTSYRISVKRMSAPANMPDMAPGAASSFLHDAVRIGDHLKVKAPAGQFVLDTASDTPAVLIGGGVGVTPMISMLAWSLAHQPERPIHLFYGVRNACDHAFKPLLEELARSHAAFALTVLYSAPGPNDVEGRDFQQVGFIDVALLKRMLPLRRHQFYVCGPPAMMAALVPALAKEGVPQSDIHFESFGPASAGYIRPTQGSTSASVQTALDVQFRKSRRTLVWTGEDASLLDLAERRGIAIEAGCRTGNCGSCETRLVSGEIRYERKPDFEISSGSCLLCVGIPVSPLVLEA